MHATATARPHFLDPKPAKPHRSPLYHASTSLTRMFIAFADFSVMDDGLGRRPESGSSTNPSQPIQPRPASSNRFKGHPSFPISPAQIRSESLESGLNRNYIPEEKHLVFFGRFERCWETWRDLKGAAIQWVRAGTQWGTHWIIWAVRARVGHVTRACYSPRHGPACRFTSLIIGSRSSLQIKKAVCFSQIVYAGYNI